GAVAADHLGEVDLLGDLDRLDGLAGGEAAEEREGELLVRALGFAARAELVDERRGDRERARLVLLLGDRTLLLELGDVLVDRDLRDAELAGDLLERRREALALPVVDDELDDLELFRREV